MPKKKNYALFVVNFLTNVFLQANQKTLKLTLRYLCIILLFSATLLQPLQSFWVKFFFELNKSYIIKNLCENRARPELKCGGKCFLMKKLAEKQKQQQENSAEKVEVSVSALFVEILPSFHFKTIISEKDNSFTSKNLSFLFQECILSTFRPPCA